MSTKTQWGGSRPGAGRPRGSREALRRNRVVIMLTDDELQSISALATQRDLPLGTMAYELVSRALKRTK